MAIGAGRHAEGPAPARASWQASAGRTGREQTGALPHDVVFDPPGDLCWCRTRGSTACSSSASMPASGRALPTAQGSVADAAGRGTAPPGLPSEAAGRVGAERARQHRTTYRWDAGTGALAPLQVITTLPTDFTGYSTTAEIAVDAGRALRLLLQPRPRQRHHLRRRRRQRAAAATRAGSRRRARHPRFICLDPTGRFLYAANEQGDTIVRFRVDAATRASSRPPARSSRNASPATIVLRRHWLPERAARRGALEARPDAGGGGEG